MSEKIHTNRLIQETSPYLLQHAHNPVDWFPWGEEAFKKAKEENKPILISIGYSTCHWCHVMERESFEDETVAKYMNEHFVNIKIDREERPDIDQIYMDALLALNGSGGWPLNCFLTSDLKPFYGGTYYPPEPKHGKKSWSQVLSKLVDAFHNKTDQINSQAEKLMDYIQKSEDHFVNDIQLDENTSDYLKPELAHKIYNSIKNNFDSINGGFGAVPKFPSSMPLRFLLEYHYHTKDENALQHVNLSLEKMIKGGIYDQFGGGFSRYSTDTEWLVPHFEKMLYDNALLVSLLSDAYLQTKNELYLKTIEETLEWVEREMTNEEGGFYSALDADSEGEEGKFYVWNKKQIENILGDDAMIFRRYYDITAIGNWEGKSIPRRIISVEELAMKIGWEENVLGKLLEKWKIRLYLDRERRVRPGLDDKSLLDWNALMCTAHCQAYKATGNEKYKLVAEKNIKFIYSKMKNEEGFYHTYKDGSAKHDAFLSDYAFFIEALIEFYQISFEKCYLIDAKRITDYVIKHFYDKQKGNFFVTKGNQKDVIVRKKDVYDNAVPSGNSTMLLSLQKLAIFFDEDTYREKASRLMLSMKETTKKHPQSFSKWSRALLNGIYKIKETAIVGEEAFIIAKALNNTFIPNKVVMASLKKDNYIPLLQDREGESGTLIYLCSNFICQRPVSTIPEYLELLK